MKNWQVILIWCALLGIGYQISLLPERWHERAEIEAQLKRGIVLYSTNWPSARTLGRWYRNCEWETNQMDCQGTLHITNINEIGIFYKCCE